ncbi:hypothetical protein E5F05_06850 [Deinococcus metallilatus]|uniref:AIPR family protein n=1 Tax=Deinococcus metallilatus TaxID=1211322 RepID=A0AAJ5F646_9DEIO|nr:AIPR family protein [Deinococcus metallilatus]MBB5294664.1 hypothetical protein [Deinococcus metallilatus]QBY07699.1 hypothetical protein E5F05_06850 [Deinococcus metallilatus]RXJ14115.1 hypothetical protein ERJ73_05685 [Deinococcus metallilatus]TLK30080.1 AIPR family protein [Deinococcus metallilatus]GMA15880.1 hypothetical protein GCM10025871_22110 [Deinococcus metallilatus]
MTHSREDTPHLKAFAVEMIRQFEGQADRDGSSFEQVLLEDGAAELEELGQCPELTWIDFSVAGGRGQPGMIAHAWGVDQHDRIHLAGVLTPKQAVVEENLPYVFQKRDVSEFMGRMLNTIAHLRDGHRLSGEEDPGIGEMAERCRALLAELDPEVVLHLFTAGHVRGTIASQTLPGVLVSSYVHDIEWLRRVSEDDPTEQLDFRDHGQGGLPCLVASRFPDGEPEVILTVLPGELLARLYDRRRDELLRRNVRIYLRSKMKVNRDMMRSAREEPERFIALNNGISAVARGASYTGDFTLMQTLDDLQIVNGGQTTATLHEVWKDRRHPADLSELRVQAKITIIRQDDEQGDRLAQQIALTANSQSRITMSDLLSGDPYERSLEVISRERRYASGAVQTGWFYERVRGQHAGLLALDRKNEKLYPRDQVIDKGYAAQLLLSWGGQPYRAALGREKALKVFKDDLKARNPEGPLPEATVQDFDQLVGLAVIRREAEGSIAAEGTMKPPLGQYLLAWLAEQHGGEIDLLQIARTGVLPDHLIRVIQQVTPLISRAMRTHPENVPHESERPKRAACWDEVRKIRLPGEVARRGTGTGTREFSRQDWQAALIWVQGTRNAQLRQKILDARRIVQSGKAQQKKTYLAAVMREAISRGFRPDLGAVSMDEATAEAS